MDDIKAISRRLTISNLIVFVFVLGIFGISVFLYWNNQIADQERIAISRLTDSVIASIDFKEEDDDAGLPDLIATEMSETESRSLSSLRLQYFSADGKLLTERGNLKIDAPFHAENSISTQDTPHALVQTKSASHGGKLLGYVRVATPLQESDQKKQTLLTGLLLGLLASLVSACAGTIWLVKLSMEPIQSHIERLERFTADAAHELRNPIAIVRTNSEVALKYKENTSTNDVEKFATILDAAKQMQKLTEDLLALARGQKLVGQSAGGAHAVVDIVNEATKSVASEANFKNSKFKIEKPTSESDLLVKGKREELFRIIRNIVENAANYSDADSTVDINIARESNSIVVNITDHGVGIDAKDLPHIFERFWRADQARNHRTGGSGLGLSIASSLAQQNDCLIDVKSQAGRGSTFSIKFPQTTQTPHL